MLLGINEASKWASREFKKEITPSNISYLIQYGRVQKIKKDGKTLIPINELKSYYENSFEKEKIYKEKFKDINWHLSFDWIKEKDRTKHVHRLHPYKGKFIPQLVEYFLDSQVDEFKKEIFFKEGDTVIDPFAGSGTTLVVANELKMDAIGVDISPFNAFISNCKVAKYDILDLEIEARKITQKLKDFIKKQNYIKFDEELNKILANFNKEFFPSPDFKRQIREKRIDEKGYSKKRIEEFLPKYFGLLKKYNLEIESKEKSSFLKTWYVLPIQKEIEFVFEEIKKIENKNTKKLLALILSRTIRSCRATTHSDLATLKEPVSKPYYCKKHAKVCKPLFTIYNWWDRYAKDTIKRISLFDGLRSDTRQICLIGDSREIDILAELERKDRELFEKVKLKKIDGIFTSPPYVGLINYHEQHEYAYELFGFERKDELEIGPLFKGKGESARKEYIEGIAKVFINLKKYLKEDANIFVVANDKFNLYPIIAQKAGLKIIEEFKRPVLNRVEKDKNPYAESVFWMKLKNF
jgi:methylase of polypeptide subunit release factors